MATVTTEKCSSTGHALYNQLDAYIATLPRQRDSLIPVLHHAQELFGYLPAEVQEHVAKSLGISVSEVMGVVTFYSYFSMQPRGRHTVNLCMGTACYVRGAKKVLESLENELGVKMGQTTEDRRFSLTSQRCFGACGLAPVIMINNDVHGRISAGKVRELLSRYE